MEAAATAEAAREISAFLAEAGRELAESVDERTTLETVAHLRLPGTTTWCIVDIVEPTGKLHRLAIVHPDPTKRATARELEDRWSPEPGDPFGAPAVMQSGQPVSIVDDVDRALARSARDADTVRALQELGIGSLLTVPMNVRGRALGAITFVGRPRAGEFTPQEVDLAQALALRSAVALDNARMYGEALELKAQAQEGSRAKSEFLANVSHELRTPLNAIAGFVDIIDLGIHGPVTDSQRSDLARIRASQQHLLVLINDILGFMQINRGRLDYHMADLSVNEVLAHAWTLVEHLARGKALHVLDVTCPPDLMMRADPDRTQQILSNLLTNAIKFTPAGGTIGVACEAHDDVVHITVTDNGIGISADQLEVVFDPFYQVSSGLTNRPGGVGLGLAISRDLARAMGGDLTVESVAGQGSRFTLTLPIGTGDIGVPPDDDA
jgi:signal transduction histidine kinase